MEKDWKSIFYWAAGIATVIGLLNTLGIRPVFYGEFERTTKENKKADAERNIKSIEDAVCKLEVSPEKCLLLYRRYEALRDREMYSE